MGKEEEYVEKLKRLMEKNFEGEDFLFDLANDLEFDQELNTDEGNNFLDIELVLTKESKRLTITAKFSFIKDVNNCFIYLIMEIFGNFFPDIFIRFISNYN